MYDAGYVGMCVGSVVTDVVIYIVIGVCVGVVRVVGGCVDVGYGCVYGAAVCVGDVVVGI